MRRKGRAAAARRATATSTPSACCGRQRPTGSLSQPFTPLRGLTPFVDHFLETAEMAVEGGQLVNAKTGLFGDQAG